MFNINSKIRELLFKDAKIKTFYISRLKAREIKEQVFLQNGGVSIDVSKTHGMICLDPFCVAVWLSNNQIEGIDILKSSLHFKRAEKTNAIINSDFIEAIATPMGQLLLYKIASVKNNQLTALHRVALFSYLLKSKANTINSRKIVSALYSYPRNIIIVSYKDDTYCNIFPMDIHCYLEQEGMYILGLRTTNVTLDKILNQKKVVICDTDTIDLDTVYTLGKHSSKSPTLLTDMPFALKQSEKFGFPVPEFTGSYKEVEIIDHKKMGFHMLLIGKVVNYVKLKSDPASFYHIGFLQYQNSGYNSVEGLY